MAMKMARPAHAGAHTSGIYADMTVDGPEIGTLVVIVDRAKNLPNRKTMGKQDPYCAARLGKEAKKTETDRRGGQTPRWDQELRFVVHESPDYYQLKISVFNDDKKTELIGEAWLALDAILVPGGGRNDFWHNLNCKGRYAGEIRIELTYYDTRPREERVEERQRSVPMSNSSVTAREGLAGPRQPKPLQKRPLPVDPASTINAPSPSYASANGRPISVSQQPQPHDSPHNYEHETNETALYNRNSQYDPTRSPPVNSVRAQQRSYNDDMRKSQTTRYSDMATNGPQHTDNDAYSSQSTFIPSQSSYDHQFNNQRQRYNSGSSDAMPTHVQADNFSRTPQQFCPENIDPRLSNLPMRQGIIHTNSSPAVIDGSDYSRSPTTSSRHSEHSPSRQSPHTQRQAMHYDVNEASDSQHTPPPPPAHRHSIPHQSPHSQGRITSEPYGPIPATAPLRIRNDKGSTFASPLFQTQNTISMREAEPTSSPSSSRKSNHQIRPEHSTVTPMPSRASRSYSPIRDTMDRMPPSLVPGYEPNFAANEADMMAHEQQVSHQQFRGDYPILRHDDVPTPSSLPQAQKQAQHFDNMANRRMHPTSVPVSAPRTTSPEMRKPLRKSVSPQPDSRLNDKPISSLPFSPDSYDRVNQSLSTSSSMNGINARYNSNPDQARGSSFRDEQQCEINEGPIIGSNGRVIDPSDHLPAATWAPEPEQKPARKGAEVTVRFRHSPAGAQPMPPSERRPRGTVQGQAMSSPTNGQTAESSPVSAARNRLQKRSPAPMVYPNSSPILPTVNDYSPSPRNSLPRSPVSDYPLRENENYNYEQSDSPSYRSAGARPPPIPSKVPIGRGQEDWSQDAFSEEMRRIDIGVGAGGRARRSRYGV